MSKWTQLRNTALGADVGGVGGLIAGNTGTLGPVQGNFGTLHGGNVFNKNANNSPNYSNPNGNGPISGVPNIPATAPQNPQLQNINPLIQQLMSGQKMNPAQFSQSLFGAPAAAPQAPMIPQQAQPMPTQPLPPQGMPMQPQGPLVNQGAPAWKMQPSPQQLAMAMQGIPGRMVR